MTQSSIPLSKTKLLLAVAACFAFVGIGCWLFGLSDSEILTHRRFNNPLFVHMIGLSAIVFAAPLIPWLLWKVFDRTPGLQFLEEGLVENTHMFSIGFVAWQDIVGLQVRQIQKQQVLYVLLRDPEKYISGCGAMRRSLLRLSMKLGPSPVTITANSLKMNFADVYALVEGNLRRYRNA